MLKELQAGYLKEGGLGNVLGNAFDLGHCSAGKQDA